jgi:hypothetical protein
MGIDFMGAKVQSMGVLILREIACCSVPVHPVTDQKNQFAS